ncbi:MAG: hypothetical protein Q8S17_13985, partial [Humidesulfovibrio sp.]|nr:hypothetical protein [Humidesulfovibrio sp.]
LAQRSAGAEPQTPGADSAGMLSGSAAGVITTPDATTGASIYRTNSAASNAESGSQAGTRAATGTETRSAVLGAEGLTLLPESGEVQDTPAGLTLLPQRDQGPSLRSPIARGPAVQAVPARLHVAAPGQGGLRTVAALADESSQGEARGLFRSAGFNMAGSQ